jgi:hypothetical protein
MSIPLIFNQERSMSDHDTHQPTVEYECKHVTYVHARDRSKNDMLVIKEVIHHPDGTRTPSLRLAENFKRDFYVAHEGHRRYTQKKDWEWKRRLVRHTCTQAELPFRVAQALNIPYQGQPLRVLGRSPYLYGVDITTTTLAKHKYQTRFPNAVSPNSVAVLDIETDVVHGHQQILSVAVTFKDRAFLAVTEDFVKDLDHVEDQIQHAFQEYLGQYQKERQITLEVLRCASPGKACYEAIQRAHQWQPDFLTIWNMDFDIPRIIEALEKEHYDIGEVFSDPRVPPRYRSAYYKPGMAYKKSAGGRHQPLSSSQRWHTMVAPASFYIIDSMCTYRQLRLAQQQESSYSLDALLEKHLGVRKLKFEDRIHFNKLGIDWHQHMQSHEKVPYLIYNLFDCISVELFDDKLKDLSQSISVQAGISSYAIFYSQPRKLVDKLHFYYDNLDKVIGCHSDRVYVEELDSKTVSRKGWIVTLAPSLYIGQSVSVIKDNPQLGSKISTMVADLDVSSAYPTSQIALNLARDTTEAEICGIEGIDLETQRRIGLNLSGGHVNAGEICRDLYKLPSIQEYEAGFLEWLKKEKEREQQKD